jgi:NAD-dependent dihydropyrimidine dehydrogenase PreA subunit
MQPQVARELIPWFPTIDYDACIGDRACLDFCKNDVYSWDESRERPLVPHPNNCVVGCNACAQICPVEAIHFPAKEELRATIRGLRAAQWPETSDTTAAEVQG